MPARAQLAHRAITAGDEFAHARRHARRRASGGRCRGTAGCRRARRRGARGFRRATASPRRSRSRTRERTAAARNIPRARRSHPAGPVGTSRRPTFVEITGGGLRAAQRLAERAARSTRSRRTARYRSSARRRRTIRAPPRSHLLRASSRYRLPMPAPPKPSTLTSSPVLPSSRLRERQRSCAGRRARLARFHGEPRTRRRNTPRARASRR